MAASQVNTDWAFSKVFSNPENRVCFECGTPTNHWASVTNGVILCLNCSGLHRGFGVSISFVRSITMDSWSEKQLLMLLNGGNQKMRELFEEYGIPREGPYINKYKTKAAYYYREKLKALAEDTPLPEPPSIEEGREMMLPATKAATSPSELAFSPVIPNRPEEKKEDLGDKVSKGFDKFVGWLNKTANEISTASKQAAEQMSTKMKEINLKEELNEFAQKAKVVAKDSVTQVKKGMGEMVDYVKGEKKEREPERRLSQEDPPQPPPQTLTLNQNYEDYFHDPEPETEKPPSPAHGVPDDLADLMAPPPPQPQQPASTKAQAPAQNNPAPQNTSNDLLGGPQQAPPPKPAQAETFDLLGDLPQTNKAPATKADTKTVDDLI